MNNRPITYHSEQMSFKRQANPKHPRIDDRLCTDPVRALREGDEGTFSVLFKEYHSAMLHTAFVYVDDLYIAEEVIQDTWIAVMQGLACFEGRSSLKTWIFSILINRAITRAKREGRFVPLSALAESEWDEFETLHFSELNTVNHSVDRSWMPGTDSRRDLSNEAPEAQVLAQETINQILSAIRRLPTLQQHVIHMRDVEGRSATEVCEALTISEINQRVLLHRARSRVRQYLDRYLQVD